MHRWETASPTPTTGEQHAHASQGSRPRSRRPWLASNRPSQASRSPTTTTPRTWASATCACSMTTPSRPAPASERTATATWKSSATCSDGALAPRPGFRWATRTNANSAAPTRGVIVPGDVQRMTAGTGVPPQRVQPLEGVGDALPADLDPAAGTRRHRARLRTGQRARGQQARQAGAGRRARQGARRGVTLNADAPASSPACSTAPSARNWRSPAQPPDLRAPCGALAACAVNGQQLRAPATPLRIARRAHAGARRW